MKLWHHYSLVMEKKTITVTGRGGIHVVPDVTRIELSLISLHDTYEAAYEQTKLDVEQLQRIMQLVNLPSTLPKTVRLDIDKKTIAEYDKYHNYIGDKFKGFQLNHQVKIDLGMDNVLLNTIIQNIGKLLKQAEITIGYTVKDARPAQLKMLERAVKDAKQKAEIMAQAADCQLGACLSINYGYQELHIYSQARTIHDTGEACCCTPNSLDITPDDLAATDTVNVEWELVEKSHQA